VRLLLDSRQEILRTAARLFQQRGYDATSMNDDVAALKLSKGVGASARQVNEC
jgi:AcrR family transcriptional regulator